MNAATKTARRDQHIANLRAAMRTLDTLLKDGLSDSDVCDCDEGNAAGITEQECGCLVREAARTGEAAWCWIRRNADAF
jgi:hypothetical protein